MLDYDNDHPQVYQLFKKITLGLIEKGVKRCGAFMIINQMRWQHVLQALSEDGFKVPNQSGPFFARKFFAEFDQAHPKFFELRPSEMDEDLQALWGTVFPVKTRAIISN